MCVYILCYVCNFSVHPVYKYLNHAHHFHAITCLPSKMKFLIWAFSVVLSFLWLGNVEGSHELSLPYQSVSPAKILKQEHRTSYHFQPKKHWLNGTYLFSLRTPSTLIRLNKDNRALPF